MGYFKKVLYCVPTSYKDIPSTSLFPVILWFLLLLSSSYYGICQDDEPIRKLTRVEKELLKVAETSFTEGKYNFALNYYLRLYEFDSTNIEYSYAIGICYLNKPSISQKIKAIPYLSKVANNDYGTPDAMYYLGLSYQLDLQFTEAVKTFENYKIRLKSNEIDLINEAIRQIEICQNSQYFLANQINVKIRNLGPNINSPFSDYTPVISADESIIIFTSRREGTVGNTLYDFDEYYEDIFISMNVEDSWTKAKGIDQESIKRYQSLGTKDISPEENYIINTKTHDAAIGLSADGQKLFVYRSDERKWGDIYLCKLEGADWLKPIKLGENINSKYWEGHASLSGDENELYFSSNRPGGYGGKDIYRSRRIPGGEWGVAVNLGPVINTPYDEDAPFIHPDGRTLYFSSQGHKTMGGFDIFVSVIELDGFWSPASNIGYPINTVADDIYFVLSANGKRGYFSSARAGGYGSQDIYVVTMPEVYEQQPVLTLVKGHIRACGNPVDAEIIVIDNETMKIQGKYKSNAVTGKYIIAIPSGKNYNINIKSEGYLFQSENIYFPAQDKFVQINKDIDLLCGELGDRICLNNIFFAPGQSKIIEQSNIELDQIYKFLKDNPSIKIMIKSYLMTEFAHLDKDVAQNRALEILNYLIRKGISKHQLASEGIALDSTSSLISLNNRVCLEMVGGFLGRGKRPAKTIQIEDDLYRETVLECGAKEIKKLEFRVQIGAYRHPNQVNFSNLKDIKKIRREIYEDGITRFTVGTFKKLIEADKVRDKIIVQGITDTWVVPYYKNKRISMQKVKELCTGEIKIEVNGSIVEKELRIPIPNATITLNNITHQIKTEFYSDHDGKFQLRLDPGSRFQIVAVKDGFSGDTIPISTSGTQISENIELTLYLENKHLQENDRTEKYKYYIDGEVVDGETKQPLHNFKIQLINLATNISIQVENFENNKFNFKLLPKSNYKLTTAKKGYFTKSIELTTIGNLFDTVNITLEVTKIEIKKAIKINNIYYDLDSSKINERSAIELDGLVAILKDNPNVKVELSSHTDARGNDDYNMALSQKRADAAVAYIHSKGIKRERIIAKGYGETQLVNDCKNGVPCDEILHQQNRRTEFKVLEVTGN